MDSLIRVRQINSAELSGFMAQVVPVVLQNSGLTLSGLALVPSGSGRYDLGTQSRPFDDVYANNLRIPSGSGLYFGSVPLVAYYSGNNAVLNFGSYYITTSPVGLTVIGPSGAQGFSGLSGATGASGISITGIFKSGSFMNIYTTDGRISNIALVSGASGYSGVSVTGFYKSGNNYMVPQYSNSTLGTPILMPSGMQGEQGPAGGILYTCSKLTGISGAQGIEPQATFYYVDPYTNINPTLNFIKGMRYTVSQSGIKIGTINQSGQNIYVNENGATGYLRFCFWDMALDPNLCGSTGRLNSFECGAIGTSTMLDDYVGENIGAWTDMTETATRSTVSFNVAWSAATGYRYGFVRCLSDGSIDMGSPGMAGVICGTASVSLFGPQGPTGAQGPQGVPGPQGQRGPAGQSSPGVGISYVEQGSYQIKFHYTDGTESDWIALPAGGEQGPQGVTGPTGPSGAQGPVGAQGPSGDRYASAFYTNNIWTTVGSGTFQGIQKKAGGVGAWQLREGTGMWFYTGDMIWFRADSLVGLAYTPWQKVLVSSNSYSTPYNFYANVSYYNSTNGEIQLAVDSTPTLPTYNPVILTNYPGNVALMNLGGLGSPGPSGAPGPSGVQGASGQTPSVVFAVSPLSGMKYTVPTNLNVTQHDFWDLSVSGGYNILTFNMTTWPTGKVVMVRIRNTGMYYNYYGPDPLLQWGDGIRFPYNDTMAPGPNPNDSGPDPSFPESPYDPSWCYANLYSFVRLPDTGVAPAIPYDIMCTYAFNYRLNVPNVYP